MPLPASGYELEFDLVVGVLQNEIPFDFAEVEVNPERAQSTCQTGSGVDHFP